MYRKQVRRRRGVLVALVVIALILLSTHFTESRSGPLHGIQRGVSAVLSPVAEGAERALKPGRDLINWFDETFDARGENEELRAEVREVRERLAGAESAVGHNRELEKLLAFDSESGLAATEALTARVIMRTPTSWYSTIGIDKGSNAGISVDDPVVAGDGLVGRVSEVTPVSAQVTLISDGRSSVSAKALPDGPSGLVVPEVGNPGALLLDFIEEDRRVKPGSTLVTAGWSSDGLRSRFPYGIPIGEVTEAEVAEQEVYQRIHVEPFVDLREVEIVQVLTGGGEEGGERQ